MIYTIVRRNDEGNVDAVISFDSVSSMDESWSATVTSQVVENGFNISDNINIESPTYNISATISSYSLFSVDKEIVWDGEAFVSKDAGDSLGHIEARESIIKVFKERSLVTLIESSANSTNTNKEGFYSDVTSGYFKEIDDCVITSLSISHPSEGEGCFRVTMTIQKITMAEVLFGELDEGEKRATLKPLMKTFEPVAGNSKSKSEGVDSETGQGADDTIPKAPEKGEGNWNAEDRRRRIEMGIPTYQSEKQALQDSIFMMKMYSKLYSPQRKGDVWVLVQGAAR